MKNFILFTVLAAAVSVAGCGSDTVLGQVQQTAKLTSIASLKPSRSLITVSGTMVSKCPTAGCWLRLRDKSGDVLVDLKSAGFVVLNVPLKTQMTVSGVYQSDPVSEIRAVGLKY